MATVYSLVCWGGKDGKTVTMTIASPCVVSLANHGLRDGTGVVFSTTGALPTGVTAGTTYYSRSTATGTFNLYDTEAHAKDTGSTTGRINTSGSQSGTHTAKGAYYLGLPDKSRWTTGVTERIYGGIKAWRDARTADGVGKYDTEVCEIGEAFNETATATALDMPCAATTITTSIAGIRTSAFHNGSLTSGYCYYFIYSTSTVLNIYKYNTKIDGVRIVLTSSASTTGISTNTGVYAEICNNIISGPGTGGSSVGIYVRSMGSKVYNNVVSGCYICFSIYYYANCTAAYIYNNLAVNGAYGFSCGLDSSVNGFFYNNIAIGNTTNWNTRPTSISDGANNYGVSGDIPWYTGTDTSITTLTTSDFMDFSNNDFRPASATSPQVNSGINVFGGVEFDIIHSVRPNYESATYPDNVWDGGPFEYDHGEGLAPQSVNISITGMASGSEIAIYKASDMSQILAPQSTTGSYSGTYTYTGDTNIIVRVRKGTSATRYLPYEYAGTITSTGFQLVVSQVPDTIAQ